MATALCTVLLDELKRGTILPDMLFGLEASGQLGTKSMHGLVNYYRSTFGLQVANPDQLEQDIESAVVMVAPVLEITSACAHRSQQGTSPRAKRRARYQSTRTKE
jgi:hypothetical protein